ncbi:MAG: hypothetical protein CUN57_03580, partial [Phototrophicales bacterium]
AQVAVNYSTKRFDLAHRVGYEWNLNRYANKRSGIDNSNLYQSVQNLTTGLWHASKALVIKGQNSVEWISAQSGNYAEVVNLIQNHTLIMGELRALMSRIKMEAGIRSGMF